MAIKVIVELQAQPGRRDELRILIETLAATQRPSSSLGSTYYESLDNPDLLIDIPGLGVGRGSNDASPWPRELTIR